LSDLANSPDDLRNWAGSIAWIRVKRAAELWESDALATARLANTDGAVMLDQRLCPIAFGCKLGSDDRAENRTKDRVLVPTRGMRHHSAAEFVDRSEGAIAIVISQDGTVTVFDRLLGDLRETEIDV
jgi:hypothetical protein